MLNFNVIKSMIEYSKEKNKILNKHIEYTIVTNLTCLNDDILHFLLDNNVSICTSLDGTREIHNYNRPYKLSKIVVLMMLLIKIAYLKK